MDSLVDEATGAVDVHELDASTAESRPVTGWQPKLTQHRQHHTPADENPAPVPVEVRTTPCRKSDTLDDDGCYCEFPHPRKQRPIAAPHHSRVAFRQLACSVLNWASSSSLRSNRAWRPRTTASSSATLRAVATALLAASARAASTDVHSVGVGSSQPGLADSPPPIAPAAPGVAARAGVRRLGNALALAEPLAANLFTGAACPGARRSFAVLPGLE